MNDYNLEFTEIGTGKKFIGKHLGFSRTKVRSEDGLEVFEMSRYKIKDRFKSCKKNSGKAFRKYNSGSCQRVG